MQEYIVQDVLPNIFLRRSFRRAYLRKGVIESEYLRLREQNACVEGIGP